MPKLRLLARAQGYMDGRRDAQGRLPEDGQEGCGGPTTLLCHGVSGTGGRRRCGGLEGTETGYGRDCGAMEAWGLSEPVQEGHQETLAQQRQLSVGIARCVFKYEH